MCRRPDGGSCLRSLCFAELRVVVGGENNCGRRMRRVHGKVAELRRPRHTCDGLAFRYKHSLQRRRGCLAWGTTLVNVASTRTSERTSCHIDQR